MEQEQQFEVRDLREKGRFMTDDRFINGYARFVGIYAVGVYNSLCRHANKKQKCWPSINKIAEELAISRPMVIQGIKNLEFWNIVKKHRVGKQCTNRYSLVSKRCWKIVSEVNVIDYSEVNPVYFKSKPHLLHESTTLTSNSKETQKKGNTKERREKTPSQEMKLFLEKKTFNQIAEETAKQKNLSLEVVLNELEKFSSYWSELTKSGKKQRWELEKTFGLKRRISTWFKNAEKFGEIKEEEKIRGWN